MFVEESGWLGEVELVSGGCDGNDNSNASDSDNRIRV